MTLAEEPQIIDPGEMSGDAIREMIKTQRTPTPEPKEEVAEPVAEPEAPTEEAEVANEAQSEEVEEELPEGVKKRIAKEVEKATRYKALIDEAVNNRKSLEARHAEVIGKTGAEPEKSPSQAVDDPEPVEPDIETFEGTNADFQKALKESRQEWKEWNVRQTRATVQSEFAAKQRQEESAKAWTSAVEKHGDEFPALVQVVRDNSPEAFHLDLSDMENWSGLAAHLGKNPAELKTLVELHGRNPRQAIAALGKLEDRLAAAVKEPPTASKLPPPMRPQGGGSAAKPAPTVNSALESGDMSAVKRLLKQAGHLPDRSRV